jgi:hypothetical protein
MQTVTQNANTTAKSLTRSAMAKLLKDLRAAFPRTTDLTELEAKAHLECLEELAERYGMQRLEQALHRCISELSFFPRRGEIEERIPPVGRMTGCAAGNCPACDGSGFKLSNAAERRYTRCHCWKAVDSEARPEGWPSREEAEEAKRSVEGWVFRAVFAAVCGKPLPENKPAGAEEYLAGLRAKSDSSAFRKLQERLAGRAKPPEKTEFQSRITRKTSQAVCPPTTGSQQASG